MRPIDGDALLQELETAKEGSMVAVKHIQEHEVYTAESIALTTFSVVEDVVKNSHTIDSVKCGRWISVKDRLPEVDANKEKSVHEEVTVLTCCNGYVRPLIYERTAVRGKTVYRWKWMWDRIFNDDDKITHWMLLPKPPEGETGND